jgi:hypothetical protein
MKGQISCTDERIDKHIEAQTDRQVCRREEFIVWWIPYERYGIRAYLQVSTYCRRGQTGSEVRMVQ